MKMRLVNLNNMTDDVAVTLGKVYEVWSHGPNDGCYEFVDDNGKTHALLKARFAPEAATFPIVKKPDPLAVVKELYENSVDEGWSVRQATLELVLQKAFGLQVSYVQVMENKFTYEEIQ